MYHTIIDITAMNIPLPARKDSKTPTLKADKRPIIIIGANGSGKTRFTNKLIDNIGDSAFRMSALEALYGRHGGTTYACSVDSLFEDAYQGLPDRPAGNTQFERLLALLMHDEMLNLINYKLSLADNPGSQLTPTRLDRVIALWQEIFPGNRVLIESGRMLFTRGLNEDCYSSVRLSDGERAVMYYAGAILYAPHNATVFIDSPEMFLHPTIIQSLWNRIEPLRPDCTFIYTTHDLEFASSRQDASAIWVREYDPATVTWDYEILPPDSGLSDELYMAIIGARKPVLFIEGDGVHSIDSKLYPLIFKDYTVKSLGSCNKVIEATRTFNDLNSFHHMDSTGIVDRDRRDTHEVEYLRGKRVMVPDVAEIENILMLEEVIRAVAAHRHRNENRVFEKVKNSVITMFRHDLRQQAMLHTRHRVKRTVEYRIDGKFTNINMLEQHMTSLMQEINPRGLYESFCREFRRYADLGDYHSVLRVYNQKSMLPGSNVAALCGLHNKEEYVAEILNILKLECAEARRIRSAVTACFSLSATSGNDNQ